MLTKSVFCLLHFPLNSPLLSSRSAIIRRWLILLCALLSGLPRLPKVLFNKEAPRAAENYRALCTGEKGVAPAGHEGEGNKYWLKGARFYRIIDRFIIQTGANTDSVFGGAFKDDPGGLQLKHEHKVLLTGGHSYCGPSPMSLAATMLLCR